MNIKLLFLGSASMLIVATAPAQQVDPALKLLIKQAFNESHSLHINQLKTAQVKVNRTMAKQFFLPKISTAATYTHLNDDIVFPPQTQQLLLGTQRLLIKEKIGVPFNAALPASITLKPVPPIQDNNIFKITSNTQVILFSGFKSALSQKATLRQENALQYQASVAQVAIVKDIWETYDKLALVNSSDKVIEAMDDYLHAQNRFVEKAISNGLATPLEREKINLARQKLVLKKIELQGNKKMLLEKLAMLTGQEVGNLSGLNPTLEVLLAADEPAQIRPELLAIDEGIKALELKRKIELTEYIPKLAAFGQYEWRKNDLSLFDPRWFAGIRLQWNLFDGFNAKNEAKKVSIEKEILVHQRIEAEKNSSLTIIKTSIDKETAEAKIVTNTEALRLAEKITDLTDKQYKNGLTNITEWLDAMAGLEKAKQEVLISNYEQRIAMANLLQAKGQLLNILQ